MCFPTTRQMVLALRQLTVRCSIFVPPFSLEERSPTYRQKYGERKGGADFFRWEFRILTQILRAVLGLLKIVTLGNHESHSLSTVSHKHKKTNEKHRVGTPMTRRPQQVVRYVPVAVVDTEY